ncbi:glycosyltransferase family 117 protein [Roseivirga echinicomitans]|uniref:Glycosyltransferase n=1 Tax=Roseivirga echinicomitans TaxID=296218 RepID=A0A150XXI4_9BACT|nr:DUF2723 domain-containing protein [Roseivirga echinicomitans]KYG83342.1 glycosyltransferase [Roseivirga echinicomitans]
MTDFKKFNNLTGWAVFIASLIVYILTLEETASFWDSGEFIAIAYKLEVSHPPGAPLYMLIGRMFSLFAFGDVTQVAYWINMVSAVSSAFAVLFLYWTIVMLGRKLINAELGNETHVQKILLAGAGVVGAMSFAFTDSFWFSAVEGEVYGMSSFFTAFVFWAMLKWEIVEDESGRNKWIILIFYMLGLSTGAHLLGLVTLPALGLIYYFKKYENPNWKGAFAAMGISLFLVMLINSFIIPGLPTLAGKFEITFVNTLGLPFGSGALFMIALLIAAIVFGLKWTRRKEFVTLNTLMLGITFVLIGYSCYAVILIRSKENPAIDQNNPENVMTFISYLKREQYGSRPLLYGQYYNAPQPEQKQGAPIYYKDEDGYKISDYKVETTYDDAWSTFLPRMYSSSPAHIQKYMAITGLREGEKPTFLDNMAFMFSHQIGHMYVRYFMFNFSGRESDIQDADYLTALDGDKDVPDFIKNNKSRNQYYMIPLILGLIGFFFQFNRDPKRFSATLLFFILTGLALVIYLNSPPIEPRERDYIYTGSYYAFAIWIGFAVLAIGSAAMKRGKTLAYGALALCLVSPIILASENWDDHDRTGRFFSVDSARNFLASCAPNAILFTGGDNDTFPLWYVQEVEGFRTDVRVIVLSYYNTDWYVDQTKVKMNESDAFPYTLGIENYRQGTNDYLYVDERPQYKGKAIDLKDYISLVKRESPAIQRTLGSGTIINTVPARSLFLNIDSTQVSKLGVIPNSLKKYETNRITFTFKQGENFLEKAHLMMLDMIASNNWERPIYFNYTSVSSVPFDLDDYLVQEGMAYRLLPVQKPGSMREIVNTDLMYDNVMNKFQFRGLDNPKTNLNGDYRGFAQNHRSTFTTLADALISEGDTARAKTVLDYGMRVMPKESLPYDIASVSFVQAYLNIGEEEKALAMGMEIAEMFNDMATYQQKKMRYDYEFRKYLNGLQYLQSIFSQYGYPEQAARLREMLDGQNTMLTIDRSNF